MTSVGGDQNRDGRGTSTTPTSIGWRACVELASVVAAILAVTIYVQFGPRRTEKAPIPAPSRPRSWLRRSRHRSRRPLSRRRSRSRRPSRRVRIVRRSPRPRRRSMLPAAIAPEPRPARPTPNAGCPALPTARRSMPSAPGSWRFASEIPPPGSSRRPRAAGSSGASATSWRRRSRRSAASPAQVGLDPQQEPSGPSCRG